MPPEENNKAVVQRKNIKATTQKDGKNYLLVIGIDTYAHCPILFNAVKDAKEIVEVLQTRFRFHPENITTLYNEKANKRNIYNAFRSLQRKVTTDDNFLVYFSGHGEFDKDFGLGYWIPVNAEIGATEQYIPNSEIRNIFSAIQSHHTFLMVDSCFSGALFAKGASREVSLRKERDPSRWGLTAGRNEIVTDGQPGKNSPFADSILYQLKNTDKPIGVAELCNKVLEVVSANANQTPRGEPLKVDGHQGGQFVFHLKMDEVADWSATLAANSVAAFQSFITKYPDSKNSFFAKEQIKDLQAETLWQKIENARAMTQSEVKAKLRLVNKYVAAYEDQTHYDEALNIGELLEYKKQFLQAHNSEFALRRFLRQATPNVKGASDVRQMAQAKLDTWDNVPEEVEEITKVTPPVKKKPAKKKKIPRTPKRSPVKPSPPTASFFEKYGKYLLLLLITLISFGVFKAIISSNGNTPTYQREVIKENLPNDTKDNETANLAAAQQAYKEYLAKGDAELQSSQVNYQTAKAHYQEAINAAKGFDIDIEAAEISIKKCEYQITEQKRNENKPPPPPPPAPAGSESELDQIFKVVEQMPRFPGCENEAGDNKVKKACADKKMLAFLYKHINYPAIARENGVEGTVVIQFVVEKNGSISGAKVVRDIGAQCGREALRVVNLMNSQGKRWIPGKQRGKSVKVQFNLPIKFRLSGTFTDARDGQEYQWVRLKDGKKWMAENLNYKTTDSWWYDNKSSNGDKYGRLYTWQAAKKACPNGWHLPSDDEWWKMAIYYGKACSSSKNNTKGDAGKSVYKALMQGGSTGFSAMLGGFRYSDGNFSTLDDHGYFWSSSDYDSSGAVGYFFYSSDKKLCHSYDDKSVGRSCRCLQD